MHVAPVSVYSPVSVNVDSNGCKVIQYGGLVLHVYVASVSVHEPVSINVDSNECRRVHM